MARRKKTPIRRTPKTEMMKPPKRVTLPAGYIYHGGAVLPNKLEAGQTHTGGREVWWTNNKMVAESYAESAQARSGGKPRVLKRRRKQRRVPARDDIFFGDDADDRQIMETVRKYTGGRGEIASVYGGNSMDYETVIMNRKVPKKSSKSNYYK